MTEEQRQRIEKILMLAESTNEHESRLALEFAKKLMAEQGIDDVRRVLFIKGHIYTYCHAEIGLASMCGKKSGCFCFVENFYKNNHLQRKKKVVFFGRSARVKIAEELTMYCMKTARQELRSDGIPLTRRNISLKMNGIIRVLASMKNIWIDCAQEAEQVHKELQIDKITGRCSRPRMRSYLSTNINLARQTDKESVRELTNSARTSACL
jgi:hypothetical protein